MATVLYQFPGPRHVGSISPPCLKIELALQFLQLDFDNQRIGPAEAAKLSPSGKLPALRWKGELLSDSLIIMDQLALLHPALTAEDDNGRLMDRLWEVYVNERLYWLGFYIRWLDPFSAPRFADVVFSRIPIPMRWLAGPLFSRRMRKRGRAHGVAGRTAAEVQAEVRQAVQLLVQGLAGGPFMQGRDTPGRADFAAASVFAQVAVGDTMPRLKAMVTESVVLVDHLAAVYAACRRPSPLSAL